jgi:AMIN domain
MGLGMNNLGLQLAALKGRGRWRRAAGASLIIVLTFMVGLPAPAMAQPRSVEVRNLGISRVGERTLLTVILDQGANPRVTPFTGAGRSQLVIEFPGAQAGRLPETLPGDESLVKSVRTETSAAGVKIILDMFPDRPYLMSRETQPVGKGLAMFRLNIRPDPNAVPVREETPSREEAPATTYQAPPPEPERETGPLAEMRERFFPSPPPPPPAEPAAPAVNVPPPTGEFAELYQLVPKAQGLWDFLRSEGFTVNKAQSYDTPGKQLSRSFNLTSGRYPEMRVNVANVPAGGPGAPNINIVDLTMDKVGGKAADDYQGLRRWSFSQIRAKYEDIGDFFEDALKPLRVQIRQRCQELAQRHAQFITGYLAQAVPQKPRLGDEAMNLIRKKVSPRFDGVQYTISENPLVILNLVDFTYIRVYYLGR